MTTTTATQTATDKRAIRTALADLGFVVKAAHIVLSGQGTHARVYAGSETRALELAAAVDGAWAQYSFVNVPRTVIAAA